MYVARVIPSDHKDIIRDVSFDFYGRRMATCSSDHTVKIWDLDENDEWKCSADWKTHSGSVWKVTWAHPEFGQVIATCSFDRTAVIWEEQIGDMTASGGVSQRSCWVQRGSLVDSSSSVTDIKFSPKHLGLMLAMSCYKDGIVRIYEARDIMNMSQWDQKDLIETKLSCASCLSWNPSRQHAPMLAVGSDDPNLTTGAKVEIWEQGNQKWQKVATVSQIVDPVHDLSFAPNVGRSRHLLAIASKDLHVISMKASKEPRPLLVPSGQAVNENKIDVSSCVELTEHGTEVWRVQWNLTGTVLSSAGDDGRVILWKANYLEHWRPISELRGDGCPGNTRPVAATTSSSTVAPLVNRSEQIGHMRTHEIF